MFIKEAAYIKQVKHNLQDLKGVLEDGDRIGEGASVIYNEMDEIVIMHVESLCFALSQAAEITGKIIQEMLELEERTSRIFVWRPA